MAAELDRRAAIGAGFVAPGNLPVAGLRFLTRLQLPVAKALLAIEQAAGITAMMSMTCRFIERSCARS